MAYSSLQIQPMQALAIGVNSLKIGCKGANMTLTPPTGWTGDEKRIAKKYKFKSFNDAMRFMAAAAPFCDETNHHPEWKNIYDQIWVELATHDAGNIVTDKDLKLAAHLDGVFSKY